MSYILLFFGVVTLLLGLIYYIIYIRINTYKGYKSVLGCVIEYLNEQDSMQPENMEFGEEVIDNKDGEQINPLQYSNSVYAVEIEYVIKNKKYHLRTKPIDANNVEIGDTVVVKYNVKNPSKAYITNKFGGVSLFVVGTFLVILGLIVNFF